MENEKRFVYRGERMTRTDLLARLQSLQRLGQLGSAAWDRDYGVSNDWEDWLDEEMDEVEEIILNLEGD